MKKRGNGSSWQAALVPLLSSKVLRGKLRLMVGGRRRDGSRVPLRVLTSDLGSQLCHCLCVRSWKKSSHSSLGFTLPLCTLGTGRGVEEMRARTFLLCVWLSS